MKYFVFRILCCFLLVFSNFSFSIDLPKNQVNNVGKLSLVFDQLPIQQLIVLVYDQIDKSGLVIEPAAMKVNYPVTLNVSNLSKDQILVILRDLVNRSGLVIERKGSVDYVKVVDRQDSDDFVELIYFPKNRDALELVEMCSLLVKKGKFAHQRQSQVIQTVSDNLSSSTQKVAENGTNGASLTGKSIDRIVFFGPPVEVESLNRFLVKLDTPQPQIEIRAGIYEYQSDVSKGSAIKAVLNFFNSDSGISFGSSKLGGDTIKLKIPNIDVIFSFLDQDSRFKNVATPKLMAKDNELARFFAGQDERVTGAVVLDRSGNPVQSKETLQAGVTLEITPRIRVDSVDISLYEAVSTFISSSSNNSDLAVLKRDIRSRLNMKPGFVYVIGGLKTHKKTSDDSRFFDYSVGKSHNLQESELLLLMSINNESILDSDKPL